MNEDKLIRTSDLYFAAFLQCVGCKLVSTERDGNKNTFTFENAEGHEKLKEAYINEDISSSVPALKYANNVRSLKTYCYIKTSTKSE
jgi:hypothetical protein